MDSWIHGPLEITSKFTVTKFNVSRKSKVTIDHMTVLWDFEWSMGALTIWLIKNVLSIEGMVKHYGILSL